eukprot:4437133-Prymnesium_polylepis.1
MSVGELRQLIARAGLPSHDCLEKSELRARARLVMQLAGAVNNAAAQVASAQGAQGGGVQGAAAPPMTAGQPAGGSAGAAAVGDGGAAASKQAGKRGGKGAKAKEAQAAKAAEGAKEGGGEDDEAADEAHYLAWTQRTLGANGEKMTAAMKKVLKEGGGSALAVLLKR